MRVTMINDHIQLLYCGVGSFQKTELRHHLDPLSLNPNRKVRVAAHAMIIIRLLYHEVGSFLIWPKTTIDC